MKNSTVKAVRASIFLGDIESSYKSELMGVTFNYHGSETVTVTFDGTDHPRIRCGGYSATRDTWLAVDKGGSLLFGFASEEFPGCDESLERYEDSIEYRIAVFSDICSATIELLDMFDYSNSTVNTMYQAMNPRSGLVGLVDRQFGYKKTEQALPPVELHSQSSVQKEIKQVTKRRKTGKIGEGFIYCVRLDGCIKIGYSRSPENRLASYRTSNTSVIQIMIVKGTQQQELAFHRKYNSRNEKYSLARESELISLLSHYGAAQTD
jgi:hypothetical protein